MNEPTVAVLVTADHEELLPSTLLFADSIRKAFPTFSLEVYDNGSVYYDAVEKAAFNKAKADVFHRIPTRMHHAKWIEAMMVRAVENRIDPLVIVDPDCMFWDNCEDFEFDHPWAGLYVPPIWNEWAGCCSFSRLHTSFLWIHPEELINLTYKTVHVMNLPKFDYRPFEPLHPKLVYINKTPYFYDTGADLYQAVGGDFFREEHLKRYDHLNSAAFFYDYGKRLEKQEEFEKVHRIAREDPGKLRGLNFDVIRYYKDLYERARTMRSLVVTPPN